MALANRVATTEREVPHEKGNFFTFRVLTGDQLDEARKKGVAEYAETQKVAMGALAEVMKSFSEEQLAELDAAMKEQAAAAGKDGGGSGGAGGPDPLAALKKSLLVKYGVAEWRGDLYEVPCTDANKEQLTTETRDWAAREAYEVSQLSEGEGRSSEAGIAVNGSADIPRSRDLQPSGPPSSSPTS